jgi:hypothetical protein
MRTPTRFARPRARLRREFLTCVIVCSLAAPALAKGPKIHSAAVGKAHPVYWTAADAPSVRLSLNVRPLIVDGRRKAWVFGDAHDVTDHTFVVLEVQHINDALPSDKVPHYIWQTASWLLAERNTGHVSAIHFTGYDPALSGISWFRDYAAFCSLNATGKILSAQVIQLGSHKPVAHKKVGSWPLPNLPAAAAPDPSALPAVTDATPASGPGTSSTSPASPSAPSQASNQPTPPVEAPKPASMHPHATHPVITPAVNTGAPKPAVCTSVQWDRDPLRAILTPRPDLPPITLDLAVDLSPSSVAPDPVP